MTKGRQFTEEEIGLVRRHIGHGILGNYDGPSAEGFSARLAEIVEGRLPEVLERIQADPDTLPDDARLLAHIFRREAGLAGYDAEMYDWQAYLNSASVENEVES